MSRAKLEKAEALVYIRANRKRHFAILRRAWRVAAIYELDRPPLEVVESNQCDPFEVVESFFWRTTHRRSKAPHYGVTRSDPVVDADPEFDAPTAFALIVGGERSRNTRGLILRHALNISGERLTKASWLYDEFSEDFLAMFRCLDGDMATPALRRLVLGTGYKP